MAGRRFPPLFMALLFVVVAAAAASFGVASSSDAEVLLGFKATISDPSGALKSWVASSDPCNKNVSNWAGIICDNDGHVSGLRLEDMSLAGSLAQLSLLKGLPGIRTLSFLRNDLEGPMPEVGKMESLRAIFLSENKFSGQIPDNAFAGMSWLKKLHLSHNGFSGSIPTSIAALPKLLELRLDDNRFSGTIPDLRLTTAKLVNVSNNYLEGRIPDSLEMMNANMFAGNKALCGDPLQVPCQSSSSSSQSSTTQQPMVIAAVAIFVLVGIFAVAFLMPRHRQVQDEQVAQLQAPKNPESAPTKEKKLEEGAAGYDGSSNGRKAPKEHEQGRLIFVRAGRERFELQDLLKSSAEILGSGKFGCSYKASLTNGPSMVVKRFRDMNRVGKEDFEEHMRRLGRLSHSNLLPLVAYYYRKDEKLMVTDYVPKRSLANALHGFRAANIAALDWPTRLKIVRGIAKGLNYLYEELQMLSVPHGHLKSSNVLLSDSFEPLLTDYALVPVMNQAHAAQSMVAHKAPECKQHGKTSKKSDIWSFGILILEILTGKISIIDSPQEKGGVDLAGWVNSVDREEWASKVFDCEMKATKKNEGEMLKLLQIGLACCEENVEKRYELETALDRIEELKEEGDEDSSNIPTEGGAKTGDDLSIVGSNRGQELRDGEEEDKASIMYCRRNPEQMEVDAGCPLVAVAIDKDKGSQNALKWAVDNLLARGQTLTLIHVKLTSQPSANLDDDGGFKEPTDHQSKELFLPFRCFCTRKDVRCKDVLLEDVDAAKAIIEFVSHAAIEKLVVGASSKGGFVRRFKNHDVSASVTKGVPDFCTVYVIGKGKVSAMRNAVRPAPAVSPLRAQIQSEASLKSDALPPRFLLGPNGASCEVALETHSMKHDDSVKSPYARGMRASTIADLSLSDTDISFVSSGRPSIDQAFPPRLSNGSDGLDRSFEMALTPNNRSADSYSTGNEFSSFSQGSTGTSWSSQTMEDVEDEMKKLRLELKHTMDMYNNACKEALSAKQKAMELQRWKVDEQKRLYEAQMAEEAAVASVEKEKARRRVAMDTARAENRIAELESQKRVDAEMMAIKDAHENNRPLDSAPRADVRYRKYTIEDIEIATEYFAEHRKIGEGGYGPVYKCHLDHTAVAVKVLRPDAAQGRSQFQQEVEVLSCIRHPNMVLLLGACPEYGCIVYEYMANGSLDDRLFRRGNSPVIPWQHRFRIACEIATGLLFLHRMKPEPLVHRDLKPGNILLDRNYVSKIGDVGLARLVPPSVADSVTQYRITSTAGTFCYIDPEYQQTGMLGVKSDIYSLGVLLLQIITAKPPMGLTHLVSRAIEQGTFAEVLDPAESDWPVEAAQRLAEKALKCTELRRKDRPDLEKVVLPELQWLSALGEDSLANCTQRYSTQSSPFNSQASMQEFMSDPLLTQNGFAIHSSESSATGRKSSVL
ncbi:unnamed protein product [Musa acuminata subsp. malaccensis]|uniref:RING-type E3 ubiquitin transferase n=1 Tax=Musa acuminata subsp. malaccensis TaxID=214687 RepID=A0A8D7F1D8_MUSAM|nr:unnamed protein product [Musa acuminata subsp. malaccensis]